MRGGNRDVDLVRSECDVDLPKCDAGTDANLAETGVDPANRDARSAYDRWI